MQSQAPHQCSVPCVWCHHLCYCCWRQGSDTQSNLDLAWNDLELLTGCLHSHGLVLPVYTSPLSPALLFSNTKAYFPYAIWVSSSTPESTGFPTKPHCNYTAATGWTPGLSSLFFTKSKKHQDLDFCCGEWRLAFKTYKKEWHWIYGDWAGRFLNGNNHQKREERLMCCSLEFL